METIFILISIGFVFFSLKFIGLLLKRRKEQKEYKALEAALTEARKYDRMIGAPRVERLVVGGWGTTGSEHVDANVRRVYQEHLRK